MNKKVFLDCGTHRGHGMGVMIDQNKIDSTWEVYGFEANPLVCSTGKVTFKGVTVSLLNAVIGIEDGNAAFHVSKDDDGGSSIYQDFAVQAGQAMRKFKNESTAISDVLIATFMVPKIDLGRFITANFNQDDYILIKMDIEGSEFRVLRSLLERNIADWIDELHVEFHQRFVSTESDESVKELIKQLESRNIKVVLHN